LSVGEKKCIERGMGGYEFLANWNVLGHTERRGEMWEGGFQMKPPEQKFSPGGPEGKKGFRRERLGGGGAGADGLRDGQEIS